MKANKKKILFLLRGMDGLGHVVPIAAIAMGLRKKGHVIYFLTYAYGIAFLKEHKFSNVIDIGKPDHPEGTVPWKDLYEITTDVIPLIYKINPDLIIVDGECDALFLLGTTNIKFVFLTTPHYIDLDVSYWKKYSFYGMAGLQHTENIIVHGFFAPINKHNINHKFVGPVVREIPKQEVSNIVSIVLGNTISKNMYKFSIKLKKILIELGYKPIIVDYSINKIKNPLKLFAKSQFIVTHGGISTINELCVMGKPSIIIYDKDNAEKMSNAKIIKKLDLGEILDISTAIPKNSVIKLIKKINDRHKLIKPIKNGTQDAIKIIENMLK